MPNEKLFTAKEAAQAVLAKAAELAKGFELPKSDMKAAPSTDKNAPGEKAQDSAAGVKASPNPARTQPNENGNPAPGALPQNTEKFGAEGLKGHLKLAKFVGRMEEKRKKKVVPTQPAPHAPTEANAEMGKAEINEPAKSMSSFTHDAEKRGTSHKAGANLGGVSEAGEAVRSSKRGTSSPGHGKAAHKEVLAGMKAAPKPKLPG